MRAEIAKTLARECGFELAGVALAEPLLKDFARYEDWAEQGMAGEMRYLTDRRAEVRRDPRNLLAGARSIVCVGKLYNQPLPEPREGHAVFSRYALGRDYHDVLREGLEQLARRIGEIEPHVWRVCVDTAPLLRGAMRGRRGSGGLGAIRASSMNRWDRGSFWASC